MWALKLIISKLSGSEWNCCYHNIEYRYLYNTCFVFDIPQTGARELKFGHSSYIIPHQYFIVATDSYFYKYITRMNGLNVIKCSLWYSSGMAEICDIMPRNKHYIIALGNFWSYSCESLFRIYFVEVIFLFRCPTALSYMQV